MYVDQPGEFVFGSCGLKGYGIIFENGLLLTSIFVPSLGSLFTHNFLLGKNCK